MKIRSRHAVEQLEQLLLLRILAGEFAGAGVLPSGYELSKEYGVARNTVGAAIRGLIGRGLCSSRVGSGIVSLPLVHALDHKLMLELIQHAESMGRAMHLLLQLLCVLRRVLTEAAADAATQRKDVHLRALHELLDAAAAFPASAETVEDEANALIEYNLWRVVTGASGNVATTATLNALRPLWCDPAVMRGLKHRPPVALLFGVAGAIEAGNPRDARAAADLLLGAREAAVRACTGASDPSSAPVVLALPP